MRLFTRCRCDMNAHVRPFAVAMVAAFIARGGSGIAQEAPRLTDNDLKGLIESVDDARDRFEDALDGEFKHSVVRQRALHLAIFGKRRGAHRPAPGD